MPLPKTGNRYYDFIYGYINKDDHSRNNANFIHSLPALNYLLTGEIISDFWLDEVYGTYKGVTARDLFSEGWIYFHDLGLLGPYCAGFSAKDIATLGLNSIATNNISTRAPRYYKSLLDHCYNFIAIISQEIAGACAINDLTAIVASYIWHAEQIKGEEITAKAMTNAYEAFIYAVNTPFRSGNSPFTNITMNFEWDPHLKDEYVVIGGEVMNIKYGDIPQRYLDMSNKSFIDAMKMGDAKGKPFTFPLITVNIYDDFDYDNDIFNYLLENMDRWGGCYFENYTTTWGKDPSWKAINKFIEPRDQTSQRSFCCRFRVSFDDIMRASGGSSFRANSGVGGVGVFNINLNKIAYTSFENGKFNQDKFYKKLDFMLEAAQYFAQKRRIFLEDHKELYPYFFFYNKSLGTFFNVLSIQGGEEAIINIGYEDGLKSPEGRKLGHEIATYIVDKINMMMERDKVPVSLEFAPAENSGPKTTKKDIVFVNNLKENPDFRSKCFPEEKYEYHGDIFVQGEGNDVFMTSGFQPPYNEKNIGAQIQISAEFQSYATGGAIQHFFLGEKIPVEMKKKMISNTFSKPVMYMTLTSTLTTCDDCNTQVVGENLVCPHCGSANIQIASRVIGYLRPIAHKNLKKDNGRLDGDDNYWQDSRRRDWATRKQTFCDDIEQK